MAEQTIESLREAWNPGVTTGGLTAAVGTAEEHGLTHLRQDGEGGGASESTDYSDMTVAQLRDEIDSRNESREDDDALTKSGTKDELIARLEEDDSSDGE
jgi:hypothetical protein